MIIGHLTRGASHGMLVDHLEVATRNAERYYRTHRAAPPIDRLGVIYKPDDLAERIIIVEPALLREGAVVSCGTASAAYAGFQRAQGRAARVVLAMVGPGKWHATAFTPAIGAWDPSHRLPHVGSSFKPITITGGVR